MRASSALSLLSAATLLAACGGGTNPHVATIANSCTASGEDPATCSCVADSLVATLSDEGLTAIAGYLESFDAAEDDAARGRIAMSAFANPVLVEALEEAGRLDPICARAVAASAADRDEDDDDRGALAGTYLPQLGDVPASERRLAAAAADRRWEFTADGKVTTYSQGGARRWTYQVRGKEIRLTGAGAETQGERRRFTFHADGRCIWDGRGNSSVDMRFCPG